VAFSSLTFLYCFLPFCLLLYFAGRSISYKNWVLVAFSVVFYAWGEPVYVILLVVSAWLNYLLGRKIGACGDRGGKKWLVLAVIINLGLLAVFKYTGFLVSNLNHIAGLNLPVPKIKLPIGISFYTFQAISYVIDVYRKEVEVQFSYRDFLLYIALFPKLNAGPIARYSEVGPQLARRRTTSEGAFYGATRFCMGLGKKVLIANYTGKIATRLLDGDLTSLSTVGAWLGILMFTFEIYFDFSGYSDMAIGLGRIFGFTYAENFNLPYISKSITEFWRRWHISLSSFFRDYVYIPLGGNRRHQVLNLLIVWGLTGLWHGASWNFVLWGLYFFVLLWIEKRNKRALKRVPAMVRHLMTMFFVVVGWALFYCTDFSRLGLTLGTMFGLKGAGFAGGQTGIMLLNNLPLLVVCIIGSSAAPRIFGLALGAWCAGPQKVRTRQIVYTLLVFTFDMALLLLVTVSLIGSSYSPFLYFQF